MKYTQQLRQCGYAPDCSQFIASVAVLLSHSSIMYDCSLLAYETHRYHCLVRRKKSKRKRKKKKKGTRKIEKTMMTMVPMKMIKTKRCIVDRKNHPHMCLLRSLRISHDKFQHIVHATTVCMHHTAPTQPVY